MSKLVKNQIRYLSRFTCGLCEQRLDRLERGSNCAALFSKPCSREIQIKRRDGCLRHYKPRKKP